MTSLISHIRSKNYDEANETLSESFMVIMEKKLFEIKKRVAAKMCEQMGILGPTRAEKLRMGVLEEDELEEMASSSYTSIDKSSTASGKRDLGDTTPSPAQNASDVETDNLIKRNTDALSRERERTKSISPGIDYPLSIQREDVSQLAEARIKIVKARIRGGKIQRRKKISNVEGYKVEGGQLQRMSPTERRHRKLGQRRGKMKRRAKMTRTLMKRAKSLRKRKSLGI